MNATVDGKQEDVLERLKLEELELRHCVINVVVGILVGWAVFGALLWIGCSFWDVGTTYAFVSVAIESMLYFVFGGLLVVTVTTYSLSDINRFKVKYGKLFAFKLGFFAPFALGWALFTALIGS